MNKLIEFSTQKEQIINQSREYLFSAIAYAPKCNSEWVKYRDDNLPLELELHNIAIGLLLDDKWGYHSIHEPLWNLAEMLENNCIFSFELGYEYFKKGANYKYLNHYLLQKGNYKEFLQSSYWKNVKELKEFTHHGCQLCGVHFNDEVTSELHHNNYAIHGFEHLTSVRERFLTLLCRNCHTLFHKNGKTSQGWR